MYWHMPSAKSADVLVEIEPPDHNGIRNKATAADVVVLYQAAVCKRLIKRASFVVLIDK